MTGKSNRPTVVELADIDPDSGLELELRFPLSELFEEEDDLEPEGELEASLRLQITGDDVYVTGTASGSVKLQCGRCLESYSQRLGGKLAVPYLPEGGDGVEEDEEDVYIYQGDSIDLCGMLREQLLLTLPINQVCDEECKGLCPKCGIDLNKGDCDCPKKDVDDRLAVLAKLKGELN